MSALKQVYYDHPKTTLFACAAAIRILTVVLFPTLPDLLSQRAELSTPVDGFKRLQEGLFLYERGLDPYDGGMFHQAPLLLPLFSLLPSPEAWLGRLISILSYTLLDLATADCLFSIASFGVAHTSSLFSSPRKGRSWAPFSIAAVYLLNPFTILTCLARPTSVFTTFFTVLSISHACQAKLTTAAFALAVAGYASLHPLMLVPPMGLLCYDRMCSQTSTDTIEANGVAADQGTIGKVVTNLSAQPKPLRFGIEFASTFLLSTAFLLGLSRLLLPSWKFVPAIYMTLLTLPDLSPNPGLWWYFFTEMFDAFREFFLGVFWLHMAAYSIPFCLRFRKQPLVAVVLMQGVICVFQPYPTAGDAGAWLSCLCLLSHLFELSSAHRYTFPAVVVLGYASLLGPAFHHLWIYAGSGNANFFYAITLVWSLALLILLTDTVYSALRDEWEAERPEGKGKEIRQI
ncbi:hypothetical protein LTR10_004908 [Elasticomyces elasticus]|nr:hypothetical protein LTR10_004908 [Elasticomyces elasticus]KAK4977223.1 hypothetical protein LTR42_003271 [Elasticomyces elasticus]